MSASGEDAEYDWYAQATVEAVQDLGTEVALAAACRGSASPSALDWLIDRLVDEPGAAEPWLDLGAGLGGPSAYLADRAGVAAVLVEPAAAASEGARILFGRAAVVATSDALPFPNATFRRAWALGTLSATGDVERTLTSLSKVVTSDGALGLLEFVSCDATWRDAESDNTFLSRADLLDALERSGWEPTDDIAADDLPPTPEGWARDEARIEALIERRHRAEEVYRVAKSRERHVAGLIEQGAIAPLLVTATPLRRRGDKS